MTCPLFCDVTNTTEILRRFRITLEVRAENEVLGRNLTKQRFRTHYEYYGITTLRGNKMRNHYFFLFSMITFFNLIITKTSL